MTPEIIANLLSRELRAVQREVRAYPDDVSLWQEVPGLPNSGGTLALHVAGNLRHYLGARLGGSSFVRDRPSEFSTRGLARDALCALLDETIDEVRRTLRELPQARLSEAYPDVVGGFAVRTDDFVAHLASHLAYHLGQLDYHRRMVTGDPKPVNAVATGELLSARASQP